MDYKKFSEQKSGELRKYQNTAMGSEDWLFIPNKLPPSWGFPAHLWPLLSKAKEQLGTLNGMGSILKNPELLLRPLQSREAITSSNIEGTYVTPEQLLLYELEPTEPTSAEGNVADWKEVHNYNRALMQGFELLKTRPISRSLILDMHRTLMDGVRGHRKAPGKIRRIQVQIGSTGKYIPPPPGELDELIGNLERFMHRAEQEYDPLVMCYICHYQFEAIHPFNDGNGRVGRLLLSLMVYQWLGHSRPWLYMSPFFEDYKEEYSDNLFRVSTNSNWDKWIEFCLNGTIIQANDSIQKCHKFNELRDIYHKKIEASATARSHQIVEFLFETSIVTVPVVKKRFDITYHTAKTDIQRLVDAGVLFELPGLHPKTFYAKELFNAAYC